MRSATSVLGIVVRAVINAASRLEGEISPDSVKIRQICTFLVIFLQRLYPDPEFGQIQHFWASGTKIPPDHYLPARIGVHTPIPSITT